MHDIVMITGSSGFIGEALVKKLSDRYQILALDQVIPELKVPRVDYQKLELGLDAETDLAFENLKTKYGSKIKSVIHLMPYNHSSEISTDYEQVTIEITNSLMTFLKKHFVVEQFIFFSSVLVHAPTIPGKKIREDSQLRPTDPYSLSNLATEKLIHRIRGDLPVVVLRIANVYDELCHSPTLSHQMARIYEMRLTSFFFPGEKRQGQPYLHLHDLVDAISIIITKSKNLPADLTLLLGEEQSVSYQDLQQQLGDLIHDKPWPVLPVSKTLARWGANLLLKTPLTRDPFIKPGMIKHIDDHYELDITQAREIIHWTPKGSLLHSLPSMVEVMKLNTEKWYEVNKIQKPATFRLDSIGSQIEDAFQATSAITIFLGLWVMSNAFTLGGMSAGEFKNQIIVGGMTIILGLLSFLPTLRWVRWITATLGMWLMTAPLIFWSTSSAIYSNDTLLGAMILLTAAFTPSQDPDPRQIKATPEGWSYNPSNWSQRLPIMLLGFIGFLSARYLAAYQLGHIPYAWDPFFSDGTVRTLESEVSKAFPVSDAGLGALSYIIDVVSASIGDRNRWRTMPWMVVLFGILIIPAGVTSITLVMLQPIGVGTWCSICLFTAFIMLLMVPPAIDEVVASIQFLRRSSKSGRPFWLTFWSGGDEIHPYQRPVDRKKGSLCPHLIICTLLGAWLLMAPAILNLSGVAANNLYIVGAIVITFAVIAFSEVARIVRLLNVLSGCWLLGSAWLLENMPDEIQWHNAITGLLLIILSIPRGRIAEHFGKLDALVRWTPLKPSFRNRKHLS